MVFNMKKLILILFPLLFLGMRFGFEANSKPSFKIQLNEPIVDFIKCTGIVETSNEMQDSEHSEYVHCKTCGYGVYLMDESGRERCTYCGVKKQYEQRKQ